MLVGTMLMIAIRIGTLLAVGAAGGHPYRWKPLRCTAMKVRVKPRKNA